MSPPFTQLTCILFGVTPSLNYITFFCIFIGTATEEEKVNLSHFKLIRVLGTGGKLSLYNLHAYILLVCKS